MKPFLPLTGCILGLVVSSESSPLFVVGIMIPSLLAAGLAVTVTMSRGNGPVVDFGLPRSVHELVGHIRSGLAWGGVAALRGDGRAGDGVEVGAAERDDGARAHRVGPVLRGRRLRPCSR